jgi:hypothetical protein
MTAANPNEDVFVGPHFRKLFRDEQSDGSFSGKQKRNWNVFRLVGTTFIENNKADICWEPV